MTPSKSYLYLSKGRILLIGNALENKSHSHHALQLTISMDGQPLAIKHPGGVTHTYGSIISPNYPHQVDAKHKWSALILINAESRPAQIIRQRYLQPNPTTSLSGEKTAYCRKRLKSFVNGARPIETASKALDDIVNHLVGQYTDKRLLDPRIKIVLNAIHAPEGIAASLKDLAAMTLLSASRLSHLFSQQMGIPIKHYLLWQKLYQAGFRVGAGQSMSDAAAAAGFSDAAHFSRTFKKMFGMRPSQIMRGTHSSWITSDTPITESKR